MWSSEWYCCNVTALAVCLLAQVKRPTQSLWHAGSITMSVTCFGHAWPDGWISAWISLSGAWHSSHACISVCTIDGGKEGTSVCAENKWERECSQPERQDLWNSSYCLPLCTVWIMSNSKQSEGKASLPRWFCTWKDVSLTRSGSLLFSISDSTFPVPKLVITIRKPHKLHCKKYPVTFTV